MNIVARVLYMFSLKKIKVGNFPTSLVFLLRLDYPTSQLPPVLGFSYTQLSRIRSLLETIYVYVYWFHCAIH